jgi:hypothetical protein
MWKHGGITSVGQLAGLLAFARFGLGFVRSPYMSMSYSNFYHCVSCEG